jgi:hypothetical protein
MPIVRQLQPLRPDVNNKVVGAIRATGEAVSAYFRSNLSHSSMDMAKVVMNVFGSSGLGLRNDWDYFLEIGREDTTTFLHALGSDMSRDPSVVLVEFVNGKFEHAAFFVGTFGFASRGVPGDYFVKDINLEVVTVPEEETIPNAGKVILTKDPTKSIEQFVAQVYHYLPEEFVSEPDPDDYNSVGASIEIDTRKVDDLEQIHGFAIYAFPLAISQEFYDVEHPSQEITTRPADPHEYLSENRMFLTEAEGDAELEGEDYIESVFNKFGNLVYSDSLDTKKVIKSLGKHLRMIKRTEHIEIHKFDNANLIKPVIFDYMFYVTLVPKDRLEAAWKMAFKNAEDYSAFVDSLPM